MMKKIIVIIAALTLFAAAAVAQPRAIGGRMGRSGIEFSYMHNLSSTVFAEFNAGMDVGYDHSPGFSITGTYNFILAHPAFSCRGDWTLYAGPGVTTGYVEDRIRAHHGHAYEHGFMAAFTAQLGIAYEFWFPLEISLDMRPSIGFHVNGKGDGYDSKVGFYDAGMYGFIPTLGFRYKF